jgi:hypothetical protein
MPVIAFVQFIFSGHFLAFGYVFLINGFLAGFAKSLADGTPYEINPDLIIAGLVCLFIGGCLTILAFNNWIDYRIKLHEQRKGTSRGAGSPSSLPEAKISELWSKYERGEITKQEYVDERALILNPLVTSDKNEENKTPKSFEEMTPYERSKAVGKIKKGK